MQIILCEQKLDLLKVEFNKNPYGNSDKVCFFLGGRSGGLQSKASFATNVVEDVSEIVFAHSYEPWIKRRVLAIIDKKKTHHKVCFFLGGRSGGLQSKASFATNVVEDINKIVFAHSREPWIKRRVLAIIDKKKTHHKVCFFLGGRSGTRTLGPLIKSQLLYQLS